MSSFRAVNTTLTVIDPPAGRAGEETTPTTPRPLKPHSTEQQQTLDYKSEDPSAKTPTRDSFHGVAGQRPLPSSPFRSSNDSTPPEDRSAPKRESSHRSSNSVDSSQDVDMDDGEDDKDDGSDNESVTSESRPSKKKKGQRFFCTEFPPCQLSFTRSEHLARHIRKHTGERPFQCHCSRRFSRLDNLRQHAQTVHVNEDIPGDSLAATGTRFQRQIRTDRVRPPANRSRASTLGSSQGSHSRGHSRNLSASSITSTSSNVSQRDELRRRPAPLAVANDSPARARLTLDTFNPAVTSSPGQQYPVYVGHSPNGFSTPASATYPGETGSPGRFSSGLQSPISTVPRQLQWETKPAPAARRLSVPSGANPFQAPPTGGYPPYIAPLQSASGSTVSGNSSLFASPTSSIFSMSHRDSVVDEAEWRRRTWHPSTHTGLGRPGMSGLSQWQTPDGPPQGFTAPQAQQAASQTMRLPGIESFDHVPPVPPLPRRQPSPMQIDSPHRPPVFAGVMDQSASGPDDRRGHASWDAALHKGLTRLEINSTPPRESPGRQHAHMRQGSMPSQRPGPPPQQGYFGTRGTPPQQAYYHHADQRPHTIDQPNTPRRNKRQAWYGGPLPGTQPQPGQPHYFQTRPSPEDSSSSEGVPTPSSSLQTEVNPAIRHSNGYVEAHPTGVAMDDHNKANFANGPGPVLVSGGNGPPHQPHPYGGPQAASYGLQNMQNGVGAPKAPWQRHTARSSSDMMGLEALVAAATREEQRAVSTQP